MKSPNRTGSVRIEGGAALRGFTSWTGRLSAVLILAVMALSIAALNPKRDISPRVEAGFAIAATADDLQMNVTADGDRVVSGGELQLAITIRNVGRTPVGVASWECGSPVSIEATLRAPANPGRQLADPIDEELRALAVSSATTASDASIVMRPPQCATASSDQWVGDHELGAGQELHLDAPWRAQLVEGVPAASGDVVLTVRAAYRDSGDMKTTYSALVGTTNVVVTDGAKVPISAAQAVDAVLADKQFGTWLREAPTRDWTSANVFLQNLGGANGIVPAGASWEVDVFRMVGGARQWAIAFVDPATGELRSVNVCERECGTSES
jgi:hypothetical protein